MIKQLLPSIKAYIGLIVVVVVLRTILYWMPVGHVAPALKSISEWPSILVFAALGLVGLVLAPRAGFAGMWDTSISLRQRFLFPTLIGLGFGVFSIVMDLIQPLNDGFLEAGFPASLALYPIGAIIEAIANHLLVVTFLVWLISNVVLRGRWQEKIFWAVAIIGGGIYAFRHWDFYATLVGQVPLLVAPRFLIFFGVSFVVDAYLYRRYGFLAAVSEHLVSFVIWYVIWWTLV